MNNPRKRSTLVALALAVGTCALAGTAHAGNNDLRGNYGFLAQGSGTSGEVLVGTLSSDGNGNLTGSILRSLSGKSCSFKGAYTVSSNLTGSMSWTVPCLGNLSFDFSLANCGKEIKAIESDGTFATYLEAYWQLGTPYSNSSLEDTYAFVCSSTDGIPAFVSVVSFDGAGHFAGTEHLAGGHGGMGFEPFTGIYSVNANGTFSYATNFGSHGFNVIDSGTQAVQAFFPGFYSAEIDTCRGFVRGGPQVVTAPPTPTKPPPTVSFGSQLVGTTSSTKVVTVEDNQELTLTVKGISIGGANSGDFHQTDTCDGSVAANQLCKINVVFKPTAKGSRSATLTVSDAPDKLSPHAFNLTGTGT